MNNVTLSHFQQIIQAAQQGKLVVFVGSGVSANSGIPTWNTLIQKMKEELPEYTSEETDYLKIAQLFKELRGEKEYLSMVKDILHYGKSTPNELHKYILDLNPCHIITTNYDNLLEQACTLYNKQFFVVSKDDDLPQNNGERMLIKMHGDFDTGNIVLTENDYFDYSTKFPLIRAFVVSLFVSKVVLFVGFSFNDINLKYILRQVRNVLHDKMQRAYLISTDKPDAIMEDYYRKKGICIVNRLTEGDIDNANKGDALISSLRTLLEYDPFNADIIDLAMSFWEEYSDQVNFLGKYLRYILPQRYRKGFWLNAGKLSLPSYYVPIFKQNLSPDNTAKMHEKYGNRIYTLAAHILNNEIDSIEDINLLEKYPQTLAHYNSIYENSAIEAFYKLDLVSLCNWIKEHLEGVHSCTKTDLLLPYILYKTGHLFESYTLFKEIAPLLWKSQKYFLYFICLYNMKTLSRIMDGSITTKPYISTDNTKLQLENIEMQKILMELPLNDALKQVLNELFSFQYVNDIYIKSIEIKQQIAEHRQLAEKGGSSFNDNVGQLLYTYHCFFDFGNENHIVHDAYSECQTLHAIVCEGIIDSIMIPWKENRPQSKLTMLPGNTLKLFLFSVQTQDLLKILKSHANNKIPASKEFKEGLVSIVHNLNRSITENPYLKYYEVVDRKTIVGIIERIILLSSYIEEPPALNEIYSILDTFNDIFNSYNLEKHLENFIHQQKPSANESIRLINHLIKSVSQYTSDDMASLIEFLSEIVHDSDLILENIVSITQLRYIDSIPYISSFYTIVNESVKKEISKQVTEQAKSLYDFVISEIYTGSYTLTPEIVHEYHDKIKSHNSRHFWTEEFTCNGLIQLIKKEEYAYLKQAVEELSTENDCLRFLLSPLDFDDTTKIKATWLQYCSDNDLLIMLKKPEIRTLAKDFCSEYTWDEKFKDKVWRLM